MLWNTPKFSKDGCKQMLYIDATAVYMQRERDRRGRFSPACLSAARLSAGRVKDENNRITAGAVQLERLGTGRLPVQIPYTSFWKLAVTSAVSTWARHLTLAGYASHTFLKLFLELRLNMLFGWGRVLLLFPHKREMSEQQAPNLSWTLTRRQRAEMWAWVYCWCCMWPRLGFSALQGQTDTGPLAQSHPDMAHCCSERERGREKMKVKCRRGQNEW